MLTNHDKTVENAIDLFEECKNLSVEHWGFKNIGLPVVQMKKLVRNMKNAKKKTFLEVVSYTEEECIEATELAIECEFDYLMGTMFYQSVYDLLKGKPIKYMPFCGKVSGSPSVLEGSIDEIIAHAKSIKEKNVYGLDILAYRYTGDPEELAQKFIKKINLPVIIAGSISSLEKLEKVKELNPWGFTIGSAFFDKKFVKWGSFKEQIERVVKYLENSK
jgi:uncharacterized protein related to proFAR isomerase